MSTFSDHPTSAGPVWRTPHDGDAPARSSEGEDFAQRYQDLQQENMQLRAALATRGTIERAKGILMGQRGCTEAGAFQILTKLSQEANVKLHLVARALVDETEGRAATAEPNEE
jgi:hypothetical protein